MKRRIALLLGAVVTTTALMSVPSEAASKPAQVGLVWFTGADLTSGNKASLTITWGKVSSATKYEVFVSRSFTGVSDAKVFTTTSGTTTTLKGLARGTDYWVQVRGVNGSTKGSRSSRQAHRTISAQSSTDNPSFKLMTYNVCSDAGSCDTTWSKRRASVLERIDATKPDVLALQEAASNFGATPPGYTEVVYKSAKRLLVRGSRFTVAPGRSPLANDPGTFECQTKVKTCWMKIGPYQVPGDDGSRYAVWAELVDNTTGKHLIVVDVHTTSGAGSVRAKSRGVETSRITKQLAAYNTANLPVVYAGDFNSHRNREPGDWVRSEFQKVGYRDAYEEAETLVGQHRNSYNQWKTTPVTSVKYGDHVDHLYVKPSQVRILMWMHAEKVENGRYRSPLGSDHSPLLFRLRVG